MVLITDAFPSSSLFLLFVRYNGQGSQLSTFCPGSDYLQEPPQHIYIGLDLILAQRALPPMTCGPGQLNI